MPRVPPFPLRHITKSQPSSRYCLISVALASRIREFLVRDPSDRHRPYAVKSDGSIQFNDVQGMSVVHNGPYTVEQLTAGAYGFDACSGTWMLLP